MGEKIAIMEIKNKKTIEEILPKLKGKREFIINIHGIDTSKLLEIFKRYGMDYSRVGFRRWLLSPKTITIEEINRGIFVFRLFCFISTIFLFILIIYWILSVFWIHLELYFISLPLASGLVSGIILVMVSLIGRYIFKKKTFDIIKKLLGG